MSTLLRSGDIKDYTALGRDGQAVYTVASQLRDAIRFKRGRMMAEYLAIPQRNDSGSKIDWYVPFESSNPDGSYFIIPWTSATQEERDKALAELDIFKSNMLDLGKELAHSPNTQKGDQLLFSRLLYSKNAPFNEQLKAIRFPNEEHIYLVNDRPVITGWGFIEKNKSPYDDPFLALRPAIRPPVAPVATPEVAPAPPVIEEHNKCRWLLTRWWFWLPLLLLLGLLGYYLYTKWWIPKANIKNAATTTQTTSNNTAKANPNKKAPCVLYQVDGILRDEKGKIVIRNSENCLVITDANKIPYRWVNNRWVNTATGEAITDPTLLQNLATNPPLAEQNLPTDPTKSTAPVVGNDPNSGKTDELKNGTQTLPETATPNAAQNTANSPANNAANGGNPNSQPSNTPAAKELALDPTALAAGKTDFLNGNWNAGAGIQDKATGKPLKLSYSFKDGQGKVTLSRGDGVTCSGAVNAAAAKGGLNINNAGIANCTDGSTYQLPNVVCKPTTSGVADCSGSYGSGKAFPMSMKTN